MPTTTITTILLNKLALSGNKILRSFRHNDIANLRRNIDHTERIVKPRKYNGAEYVRG